MSDETTDNDGTGDGVLKEFSVTPVLTSLLKPSASYLGKELRSLTKLGVESLKEFCRRRNLEAHAARVQERLDETAARDGQNGSEAPRLLEQLEIYEEWTAGVQEVDPAEAALSSMWQELLFNATQRRVANGRELVRILKQLSEYEAKLLLRISREAVRPRGRREAHYLKRLKALNLVIENPRPAAAVVAAGSCLLFGLSIVGFKWIWPRVFLSSKVTGLSFGLDSSMLWVGAFLGASLIITTGVQWFAKSSITWQLDWLGRDLLKVVAPTGENPSGRAERPRE